MDIGDEESLPEKKYYGAKAQGVGVTLAVIETKLNSKMHVFG